MLSRAGMSRTNYVRLTTVHRSGDAFRHAGVA